MRIAQVSPLYESVPPAGYGGTERVVSWLTEELVAAGHDVTLFASGDSRTKARLVPMCPRGLRTDPNSVDYLAPHLLMLEQVRKRCNEFDIIHYHTDYLHFSQARQSGMNHVTTLHGRLDTPDLVPLYREFTDVPVISISRSQRKPLPWVNWVGNIYHGLPQNLVSFHAQTGKYLAFLGRMSREKRPDRVIEIACAAGIPVKMAAKIDAVDRAYFETTIKPLMNSPWVEFVGEIGDHEKDDFLGKALACLFPVDWPEPFGLAMIEALACGTPVIAFGNGSVPEIVEDGVTGFIVDSVQSAVEAVGRVASVDRSECRASFEKRFTVTRMAQEYLKVYNQFVGQTDAADRALLNRSATGIQVISGGV